MDELCFQFNVFSSSLASSAVVFFQRFFSLFKMNFLFWDHVTDMASWRERREEDACQKVSTYRHAMSPFGHAVGPGEGKGCFGSIKYALSEG